VGECVENRPARLYTDDPVERTVRIAVIGDRQVGLSPQDTIEPALQHSGAALDTAVEAEWLDTRLLATDASTALRDFDALWSPPGGPFADIDGALAGIRFARETGRPLLGTCGGFQLGVVEFARNVAGVLGAHHAEYDPSSEHSPLVIDELLCSLVGQTMHVRLLDDVVRGLYGTDDATERYYCRFGLNESYLPALRDAGLIVAGIDQSDGTARIMRVVDHPFFVLTLFVPQTSSNPDAPHPVVTGLLAAALRHAHVG
jgi:CTP synthase (UTP-ammonia lyase)